MEKWRLIKMGVCDAFTNMAIDEAILRSRAKKKVPNTLRLYEWFPPAISIGYFQSIDAELDFEKCKEYGIDVIRRLTGGGAVFHEHEITYSVCTDLETLPANINESYKILCKGIILGLKLLDINAEFKPINDILVNGRKISGNAQTRRFGGILQHGTILCDVNVEKMFSLLKIPSEKIRDKKIKEVKQRVTSIKNEVGRNADYEEVKNALAKGFSISLNILLEEGELTKEELELAEKLKNEKYSKKEWNFRRG